MMIAYRTYSVLISHITFKSDRFYIYKIDPCTEK